MTEQDKQRAYELGQLSAIPAQMKSLTKTVNDNQVVLREIATSLATFASIKDGLDRLGDMHDEFRREYKADKKDMQNQITELRQRPANEALAARNKIRMSVITAVAISVTLAFMWAMVGGKP